MCQWLIFMAILLQIALHGSKWLINRGYENYLLSVMILQVDTLDFQHDRLTLAYTPGSFKTLHLKLMAFQSRNLRVGGAPCGLQTPVCVCVSPDIFGPAIFCGGSKKSKIHHYFFCWTPFLQVRPMKRWCSRCYPQIPTLTSLRLKCPSKSCPCFGIYFVEYFFLRLKGKPCVSEKGPLEFFWATEFLD